MIFVQMSDDRFAMEPFAGIHLNQITGHFFEPNDLLPGNIIKVYNNEMLILDMDEYSRKVRRPSVGGSW